MVVGSRWRLERPALGAPSSECEVLIDELEADGFTQLFGPRLKERRIDHFDGAARCADHVGVASLGQVVHGGAVPEMYVGDEPHRLEGVEKPVHRGHMHLWQVIVYSAGKIVGGHEFGLFEQHPQHRPALIGHSTSTLSDGVERPFDRGAEWHRVTLTEPTTADR